MCTILEGSSLCRRNSPRTDTHMLTPTQNSTVSLYYIGLFYIGGTTMAALFFCPHCIVFAAPRLQVHSTLSSIIAATEFFVRHLIFFTFLPSFFLPSTPMSEHIAHTHIYLQIYAYMTVFRFPWNWCCFRRLSYLRHHRNVHLSTH